VQGGADALQMSLSEPIGGGLFVSNVVFGAILLLCTTPKVRPPSHASPCVTLHEH
jgi:hypothetical protein